MLVLIAPSGMLGRAFVRCLTDERRPFRLVGVPDLDLAQRESVELAIGDDAEVVINCAAWTDVDGAEANEAAATAVNGVGVGYLARRCSAVGARLVHFSTDYVFDGKAIIPYRTDQLRAPLNAYGRSKAAGEEAIEAVDVSHLLIRTSWLYAPWGKNFVRTMTQLGRERRQLKVVNDQRGRPTSAVQLARATLALLGKNADGIFHVAGGGECSWWELAAYVMARANIECDVLPCTTAEFPRPAARPAYSVLDLTKTEALLGPIGSWRGQVDDVLAQL